MKKTSLLILVSLALAATGCKALQVLETWNPYQALYTQPAPSRTGTAQPTAPPQATATRAACLVTAPEALNLRGGPGLSYGVIAWLTPGDRLTIIQTRGAWAQVETAQSARGWINQTYCKGK